MKSLWAARRFKNLKGFRIFSCWFSAQRWISHREWSESQWFEINRELAVSVVKDTFYYPKFKEFCAPACYMDEHYFPTMLTIEKPAALANRSVTWVDWSRGGAHPATFGAQDINEEFFAKILKGDNCTYNGRYTSMCSLFARKISPSAFVAFNSNCSQDSEFLST